MSTTSATVTASKPYRRLPLTPDNQLIDSKKVILQSPRSQVIMSFPKNGKTDQMIGWPKFFIGDTEEGTDKYEGNNCTNLRRPLGTDLFVKTKNDIFIPAGIYETVQELSRANQMARFNKMYEQFAESRDPTLYNELVNFINEMPFPIFAFDTLTKGMDLLYDAALAEYNDSLSDPTKIKHDIHKVDNYGGSKYIRQKVLQVKAFIERHAAPFIIYCGHVKQRKAVLQKGDEEISVPDLALEGQLPLIFTHSAEAVAIFIRNENGCYLDYRKKSEDDIDARPRHLANRLIKIADLHKYEVNQNDIQFLVEKGKVYWERIYPEIKF